MKNSIKLTMFVLATSLLSCHKDQIEVVKNLDTSWKVDSEITEADIRTRLGYDPRFTYIYVDNAQSQIPMYMLSNTKVEREYNSEFLVKLTKSYTKDVRVTLNYNPELFEQVKQNYQEHQLGDETYFQIEEKEKVLKAGQTQLVFNVKLKDIVPAQEKTLLPFSISIDDQEVRLSEGNTNAFISILKQQVSFNVLEEVEIDATLDEGQLNFETDEAEVYVLPQILIPNDYSLKLQKDESYQYEADQQPFPEGTITHPDTQSLKDKNQVVFEFQIKNKTPFTREQKYVLPMKLFLINNHTGEETLLEQSVKIMLKVSGYQLPEGNNIINIVGINKFEKSQFTNASIKQDIESIYTDMFGDQQELENSGLIKDNDYETKVEIEDVNFLPKGVIVNFSKERKIKSIQLKMKENVRWLKISAKHKKGDAEYVNQGIIRFRGKGDYYVITFKKPIKVESLFIDDFQASSHNLQIYEIDFN